jgi:hypothetical protein
MHKTMKTLALALFGAVLLLFGRHPVAGEESKSGSSDAEQQRERPWYGSGTNSMTPKSWGENPGGQPKHKYAQPPRDYPTNAP